MKSIKNTTTAPIRVPLPQGKLLFLGPRKTGQIADPAAEHPALVKLIEAGKLEVVDDGAQGAAAATSGSASQASTQGKGLNAGLRKAGDR